MISVYISRIRMKIAFTVVITVLAGMFLGGCSSSGAFAKNMQSGETTSLQNSTQGKGEQASTSLSESSNSTASEESQPSEKESSDSGTISSTQTPNDDNIKVKALYLTGWTVSSTARLKHFIELANTTEINSYVVDVKDDDGLVCYESQIPAVREVGGWIRKYNPDRVIKELHDNNIHVIARIVCFKDPVLSSKKTELSVKNKNGKVWKDTHDKTWLNPWNEACWPYLINIAKEAVKKGFDEIQFDYVRFPNDGAESADFGNPGRPRYEAINEFLSYARNELPGVVLSADVFGIVFECPGTTGDSATLGQNLETVGKEIDYISPMAYPSHYALGQIVNKVEFSKPDFEPYSVVYNTLIKGKSRIEKVSGYKAKIRPYIQDFTATWIGKGNYQEYGAKQMRQQIKAVTDAGLDEWIFWDAKNTYSEDGLEKEGN